MNIQWHAAGRVALYWLNVATFTACGVAQAPVANGVRAPSTTERQVPAEQRPEEAAQVPTPPQPFLAFECPFADGDGSIRLYTAHPIEPSEVRHEPVEGSFALVVGDVTRTGAFRGTRNDDYASATISLFGLPGATNWMYTLYHTGTTGEVRGKLDLRPSDAERLSKEIVCRGGMAPYITPSP